MKVCNVLYDDRLGRKELLTKAKKWSSTSRTRVDSSVSLMSASVKSTDLMIDALDSRSGDPS